MHLTILTQYYPPETGAPQRRLSELAQQMVQRGHRVTVLTAMPNYPAGKIYPGYGGLLRRGEQAGVTVVRTAIYPAQKADFVRRLTNYLSFTLSSAVVGSLILERPDYLLVESPPLFLGLAGFWLSRLKGTRLIFNVSDLWPESAVRLGVMRPDSLICRLSGWLEAFCYRRAWLVTGQSKSILANIAERFPDRPTFHFSNGVDTRNFSPSLRTAAVEAAWRRHGECVILYAGLHGLAQGLNQVLAAARTVLPEGGFRFVFIGDGPEKEALVQQANAWNLSNVTFLAPRPAAEIPPLLASADVVVVPLGLHIVGAVPSKLYEAMASGRPVVLVAEGEAAEIVQEHEAGLVVTPGDVPGLVKALQTLRRQPQLRQVLGANGQQAAERCFDRTKIVARFARYLETNLRS